MNRKFKVTQKVWSYISNLLTSYSIRGTFCQSMYMKMFVKIWFSFIGRFHPTGIKGHYPNSTHITHNSKTAEVIDSISISYMVGRKIFTVNIKFAIFYFHARQVTVMSLRFIANSICFFYVYRMDEYKMRDNFMR